MFLNLDELENCDINGQNEVWIKSGKCFADQFPRVKAHI